MPAIGPGKPIAAEVARLFMIDADISGELGEKDLSEGTQGELPAKLLGEAGCLTDKVLRKAAVVDVDAKADQIKLLAMTWLSIALDQETGEFRPIPEQVVDPAQFRPLPANQPHCLTAGHPDRKGNKAPGFRQEGVGVDQAAQSPRGGVPEPLEPALALPSVSARSTVPLAKARPEAPAAAISFRAWSIALGRTG